VRPFVVAALIFLAAPAAADEDAATAASMFKAASAAYARGEYRAAATAFEEADRRAPRAAAVYNAALAWDDAGDKARAADDYAVALSRTDITPANATRARERLGVLDKHLAIVDITAGGATISLAYARRSAPTRVYVAAGSYTVEAVWPDGRRVEKKITVEIGTTIITLEPPPLPPAKKSEPPPPPPPRAPDPSTTQQNIGIGFLVFGGVGAASAVFLGVRAISARDEFNASGHTDRDARERAASLRTWTNVAWLGAGVLAATGTILIITAPRAPAVTVGLGEVGMRWTF
jgi:hypothetical protein